MRLQLILPRVEPSEMNLPSVCPYEDCQGRHFRHHQEVDKPVKDMEHDAVFTQRYECLRCKRTFRLYPPGVTRAQTSQRVKGLGVMLYVLGLSYGATSLALEALGVYMCKSSVYVAVQAAAEKVPGLKRSEVFAGIRIPALGSDVTSKASAAYRLRLLFLDRWSLWRRLTRYECGKDPKASLWMARTMAVNEPLAGG